MSKVATPIHRVARRQLLLHASSLGALAGCHSPALSPADSQTLSTPPEQLNTKRTSTMTFTPAFAANHTMQPLPFKASALNGLSERLITSHHENNYGGAVRNLNRVEQELSQINKDTPPLVVAALRERELTFRNSKTLHEAYFGNLGGNGKVDAPVERALVETYGSLSRWEEHLRLTALGLGGGSGWAILGFELDSGALRTVSSGHHTQNLASCVPLMVLDMYEHSFHLDFGAAAAKYVDAFIQNINWEVVAGRLERAQVAHRALVAVAR